MDLPAFLHNALAAQYGAGDTERILKGYGHCRPVSFRVNALKTTREEALSALEREGIAVSPVPWYDHAFYTAAPQNVVENTSLYREGKIYLQSLSSMLPPLFLEPKAGESILDMTAAPGGKTTQLAAMTKNGALVTACEKDAGRFERLKYNAEKQGATKVTLLHTDSLKLSDFFRFDKILLDAPCSGSGTLCENEPIRITEKTFRGCMAAQRALLKKAWGLLKQGGTLVYSTCSVLKEENGEALSEILKQKNAGLVPLEWDKDIPALPSPEGTLTVCPSPLYEGFFVAKLIKG